MKTHPLSAALAASPVFTEVDRELASAFVRRAGIDGEPAMAVALATALLSRARQNGHSALTLEDLADQATELAAANSGAGEAAWPHFPCGDAAWWRTNLAVEEVVSGGTRSTPLVLSDNLLQFKRLYDAEKRIAARVTTLLAGGGDGLRIITGGPGTGKTTLVARQLLEMVEKNPELRIALAAPTGKAADRVSESIRMRLDEAKAPEAVRARVPKDATTLHRLLGYNPSSDRYWAKRGTELAFDVVIVDEASMIDVLMMDALLAALADGTKLLLVGDHNQLASVDAGDVLGTLCRTGFGRAAGDPLHEAITLLTHSHRFANHPSIGAIADAILAGDGDRTMAVLQDGAHADVNWLPAAAGDQEILAPLVPHLERCLAATSPQELLEALNGFRVLAPEREGKLGVEGINALIEQWLRRRGVAVSAPWYHGRPVLVTANDYSTNVFNGDLGVVWNKDGVPLVHFSETMGTTRAISPARLPDSVTAWAMTVHKAQGSEFDDVMVVLPARGSRVIGRELLYTAVTRARQRVTVVGEEGVIRGGVERTASRQSGLERMLANA
jgi:exodeoxyribonuclease V alpha subunit